MSCDCKSEAQNTKTAKRKRLATFCAAEDKN